MFGDRPVGEYAPPSALARLEREAKARERRARRTAKRKAEEARLRAMLPPGHPLAAPPEPGAGSPATADTVPAPAGPPA